jgi:hypothetical protein
VTAGVRHFADFTVYVMGKMFTPGFYGLKNMLSYVTKHTGINKLELLLSVREHEREFWLAVALNCFIDSRQLH